MANLRSLVVLAAVVLAAAGLAQTSPGHALLRRLGFEKSAAYTELAFTRPQSLPEQLTSRTVVVDVPFEIHNVSPASRDYRWSIMVVRGGHGHHVASGHTRVPAGRTTTVGPAVAISCVNGRLRLQVVLASPHESIYFWTACWSPGARTP
jgi:hypothetical protein